MKKLQPSLLLSILILLSSVCISHTRTNQESDTKNEHPSELQHDSDSAEDVPQEILNCFTEATQKIASFIDSIDEFTKNEQAEKTGFLRQSTNNLLDSIANCTNKQEAQQIAQQVSAFQDHLKKIISSNAHDFPEFDINDIENLPMVDINDTFVSSLTSKTKEINDLIPNLGLSTRNKIYRSVYGPGIRNGSISLWWQYTLSSRIGYLSLLGAW